VISLGDLIIDVPAHRVEVQGEEILLTALEFRLLLDLATRAGRVQSRDALLERVWGYSPNAETRTVDTHVKRLREKLGAGAIQIETVRGVGYRALKP
jgi:two-component system phosphate regulon response regulator PhoB